MQVQFTTPPGRNSLQVNPGSPPAGGYVAGNPYPDVRVQLRDSNGGHIPHLRRLAVSPALQALAVVRAGADGARRSGVIYTYHLGDGQNADTLLLQINEREFVVKVPQLGEAG